MKVSPAIQKQAFVLLDALSGCGMNAAEMGAFFLGMAIPALIEDGRTRSDIHTIIDKALDEQGAS